MLPFYKLPFHSERDDPSVRGVSRGGITGFSWLKQAVKATSINWFLCSKYITIRKTVDMLIGTWCIEHDMEPLHKDKDFDQMAAQLPLRVYV